MIDARLPAPDLAFFRTIAESGVRDGTPYVRLQTGEILFGFSDWTKTYYAPHFEALTSEFEALNIREESFGAAFDALISFHYENANTLRKSKFLTEGGVAMDVGVRAGHWLVKAAPRCARVIGVDPTDFAEAMVQHHVAANELNNVQFVRAAVGATDGERKPFYAGSSGEGHSGFFESTWSAPDKQVVKATDHEVKIELETRTIDSIVQQLSLRQLHLIVLEINGAERQALQGASATLTSHCPALYITNYHAPERGGCMDEIVSDMDAFGYSVWRRDSTTSVMMKTRFY